MDHLALGTKLAPSSPKTSSPQKEHTSNLPNSGIGLKSILVSMLPFQAKATLALSNHHPFVRPKVAKNLEMICNIIVQRSVSRSTRNSVSTDLARPKVATNHDLPSSIIAHYPVSKSTRIALRLNLMRKIRRDVRDSNSRGETPTELATRRNGPLCEHRVYFTVCGQ